MTPILAATLLLAQTATVTTPAPGSKLRTELLDTWRAALKKSLRGKQIKFRVQWMKTDGTWAFVDAEALDTKLKRMDWTGTAYQEQQEMGVMDQMSQCLLLRVKGKWTVKTMVMGATDVAWLDWPTIHKAPKAIFPLPKELQ